ncbi:PEPxxWA-CTERM sorting domain-containing protein [Sphingomonas sp. 1P08PE]|uniref:PEPxxWA-CTERM sorting domain-containing protein n=1 Tax=Sphingomonas sp. 1P08PE TaxID=554122 RepID=UPI0039A0AD5F
MNKLALTAAGILAAIAVAAPASAITVVSTRDAFDVPVTGPSSTVFTFNSGNTATEISNLQGAGFTLAATGPNPAPAGGNFGVRTGSNPNMWSVPTPGDNSPYASVQANSSVSIFNRSKSYDLISLYVGSVDSYNSISLLTTTGSVIRTYTGTELLSFATPAGTPNGQAAYRVTFTRQAGDAAFGGLRVASTEFNAAEFDNLVFAVPEPSTWALMLAGFGMVGFAMRSRRRTTTVFA